MNLADYKPELTCPKCECPYFTPSDISKGRYIYTDVLYSCLKCGEKIVWLVEKSAAIRLEQWFRIQQEEARVGN